MKKILFFFSVFAFSLSSLFAQNSRDFFSKVEAKSESGGEVKISQSPELFQATNEHIYYVKNKKGAARYRIWIYTGSRAGYENARAKFVSEFPDYTTHILYEPPDFQVFVGDFYRRNDAKRALKEIKKVFPNAYDRGFSGEIESDKDYLKHIK